MNQNKPTRMTKETFYDELEAVASDYVWFTYHPEDLELAAELEKQSSDLLTVAASGQAGIEDQHQVCTTLHKINNHVLNCLAGIDYASLEKSLANAS
jgi:hypothetical protein